MSSHSVIQNTKMDAMLDAMLDATMDATMEAAIIFLAWLGEWPSRRPHLKRLPLLLQQIPRKRRQE